GRPRHYLWITEQVNSLVPEGESVSPRDVHTRLLEQSGRFVRAREGTYTLAEWQSSDGLGGGRADLNRAGDGVVPPGSTREPPRIRNREAIEPKIPHVDADDPGRRRAPGAGRLAVCPPHGRLRDRGRRPPHAAAGANGRTDDVRSGARAGRADDRGADASL